jgi:hypothetical protein
LITRSALLRSPAVIRLRVFLGTAFALGAIVVTVLRAQSTDDEKNKKAREEMRAVTSPKPSVTPSPTAKPKPAKRKPKSTAKKTPTPTPTPKAKAKATATPEATKTPKATKSPGEADESPAPKSKASPKKTGDEDEDVAPAEETPEPTTIPAKKKSPTPAPTKSATPKSKAKSKKSPTPKPDKSPSPKKKSESPTPTSKSPQVEKAEPTKSSTPAATTPRPTLEPFRTPAAETPAVPRPAPRPSARPPDPQTSLPSDITVEKSGLEQEQGFEPPPPPPPRRGFWPWSRRPANYRYLSAANIDAIRRAPVQRNRWKFVIVHNSGTRQGSARVFDYYHRRVRRMRNGLAYHFVIGNGTSTRDGQIEIGDRWVRQARGGHVHSDYMNNIGLGICLVGDFNRQQPTRAQLEATEELIKYLQDRCGSGKFSVRPHREVNPPRWATDCPGDVFPYGWFSRFR